VSVEDLPGKREGRLPASNQRVVLALLAGAIFLTVSIGLAQFVLSYQAPYPVGTLGFRAFWGLPFGWLRRTVLSPPPTMSSPSLPIRMYDVDFVFFLVVLVRQGDFRRRFGM
jgi:hypothetical protein